ncbi:hypothetical protein [Haloprofundus halophilus]|uniref:hypothetical protein n=1 Tax=Haloprofundus halophilus TaxID=2283527 RepID=UPI000E43B7EF|nr:hypothetical protein [Haloprofundus halophilus]
MERPTAWPRKLAVFTVVLLACSGCLTVQPTVSLQTSDATVFENVSTTDRWGTASVDASVTLTSEATTQRGVTKVSVISESGKSFYTTTVDTGQTDVSVVLPTGQTAQIYAVNTVNGTVVARQNVTIGGSTYP